MPADRLKSVVLLALAASVASTAAMLWAAASTGSAALFASGVLFLAAGCSQTLMLLGLARADRTTATASTKNNADLYVWSFVAALILFSLGAGVAVSEGIGKITDAPRILLRSHHASAALAIAFGVTVAALARVLAAANGPTRATIAAPALVTTRIETLAALAGLIIAGIGVGLSYAWDSRVADGAAAIGVGLVTGAVAASMGIEIRRLLMSEARTSESMFSSDAASTDTARDDTETARDEAEQPVPEHAPARERPTAPARAPSDKAPPRLSRRAQKRREQQQRRHPQQRSDT